MVVFYGANDGMLHAVSGNSTGTGAGEELWSFVPEEMFGKLNRLRVNTPEVRLPSTPAASPATPRDYFIDGPIGVYQRFDADANVVQAIIFVGMRRGGRLLYAFDVTNPAAPTLLWRKTHADLPELGQSWSEPKVARIKGNINPVLVFGAGYDAAAEDANVAGRDDDGQRDLRPRRRHRQHAADLRDDARRSRRSLGDRFRLRRLHRPRLRRRPRRHGLPPRLRGRRRQFSGGLDEVHRRRSLRRHQPPAASSSSAPTSS